MKQNIEKYRSAIILCGGKGTRLGALSKKKPKTLIKIQSKEILWYIINILITNKFNHFILPLGFKGVQIIKFIKKNFLLKKKKLKIDLINTGVNSSISQRIYKIKKKILSSNFLLLNGDAIFNFNLDNIYQKHVKKKYKMTFISSSYRANFGTIEMQNNKVINFQRNLTFDSVKSIKKENSVAHIYSGISIMNKSVLKKNFKRFQNFEKELYPWIINTFRCNIEKINGFFHSIDNQKDISTANIKNSEDSKYLAVRKVINFIKKKQNKFYNS